MPTHTWSEIGDGKITLDFLNPDSCLGTFSQVAARDPRGVRAINPTHSIVVFGDRAAAEEFVKDDEFILTSTAPESAYGKIIERIRTMRPDAYFFLMTMPKEEPEKDELKAKHRALLLDFAKKFPRTYVIDLYTYAPVYDTEFNRRFFLGHMNPMGYILTARMVESYIDYLIRHNPEDFNQVPFIGTDLWYHKPE